VRLPDGWRLSTIGGVADTALGKMLDRGKVRGLPEVPYLRNVNVQWGRIDTDDVFSMEMPNDERDRFEVRAGDLLVCEGGEIGRAAIWPGGTRYMAYQKALHRLRPRPDIDTKFLRYLLEHQAGNGTLARHSTGSTIAHLPQQRLREVPVPLPTFEEQRRIVDILEDHLSRLDAADVYTRAAGKRLKTFTKSILINLVPDQRDYPSHWLVSTVADAGKVELGRQRHPDWHAGPKMRPYLRVANVFEDRIDTTDVKEMHWSNDTFERFRLHAGDVLLNEGQSPDLLGRPALYRGDPAEVAFTNTLIRFQANPNVLPEFALLVFRRHMHAGRFKRESRITTNIAHLSTARLKPIEFPVPPVDEQHRIINFAAEQLTDVTHLGRVLDVQAKRWSALRRALLRAAFGGKLTGRHTDHEVIEELAQ